MNECVLKFLYLDFLLDPRFSKIFSDEETQKSVENKLAKYFDEAIDRKGFNFSKDSHFRGIHPRPAKYINIKKAIVDDISKKLFDQDGTFSFENHILFGKKCQVNSSKFFVLISGEKGAVSLDGAVRLEQELESWGVSRFKSGLDKVYRDVGGFYDAAKWTDFQAIPEKSDPDILRLPAVDEIRVVDREAHDVVEIENQAQKLVSQLQTGNDLGNLSPEEASAAVTEIKQIITAFQGSRVRAGHLFELSKTTLTWIASKAADALIGILATALLASIAAYLGFAL